jgi:hypothetical protein
MTFTAYNLEWCAKTFFPHISKPHAMILVWHLARLESERRSR